MCSAILIYTYMHTIYMCVVLIYIINFGGMANENYDIYINSDKNDNFGNKNIFIINGFD